MNIQEQIKSFEAKRAADAARMETLMSKAAGEGRGLDATEAEEYETANTEVKSTDTHLQRLRELEKVMVSKAAPVNGQSQNGGSEARQHNLLQLKPKLEKGQEFARFALCLAAAKGNHMQAYEIAKSRFADSPQLHTILKAAVAAGTTTDPTWAGPLLEYNQFAGDFVEYLRPMTIVGKFGQGAIPSLRRIPFNVHIRGQTSGGDGYWVGQGAPKPVTKFDFNDTYLSWAKVANIAVLTEDMIRFSNPSADMLVRQALAEALIARLDIDFVDPNKALVANVSPASITNGAITVPSTGTDLEAARVDANLAMNEFIERNISLTSGVWIMSNSIALALSQMRNALGQKEHPDLTMNGGTYEGLPVITSQYVAANSGGSQLILASADNIWLADDGQVVIKTSNEASLQMLDNPTNNAASATATTMVSMFQTNSIAMLAERWINWQRRRDGAVVVVTNANYSVTA